jgi:hypothetical protein
MSANWSRAGPAAVRSLAGVAVAVVGSMAILTGAPPHKPSGGCALPAEPSCEAYPGESERIRISDTTIAGATWATTLRNSPMPLCSVAPSAETRMWWTPPTLAPYTCSSGRSRGSAHNCTRTRRQQRHNREAERATSWYRMVRLRPVTLSRRARPLPESRGSSTEGCAAPRRRDVRASIARGTVW